MRRLIAILRIIRDSRRSESPSLIALGQFASAGLALISAPIVARAIGPTGRGETAAVLAAFYIWPIVAAFGMQLEVRRASAAGTRAPTIRRARDTMLILFIPSAVVGWALQMTIFDGLDKETQLVATLGIIAAPLMVSWMCDQSVLIADKNYRAVAVVQVTQPATYLAFVMLGLLAGVITVPYVLSANIAGTAVTALYAASRTKVGFRGARTPLRPFLKKSMSFSGSSIAEATAGRLDQLVALPLLGATQTGFYSVAATIGGLAMPLGHALAADSFNEIARLKGDPTREERKREHVRSALAGGVLIGTLLAATSPLILPLLFGPQFKDSILPAIILSIGGVAAVPAFVASLVLAAEGRGVEMTFAQLARLISGMTLLLILGPPLGAIGAATASSFATWLLLGFLTFRACGSLSPWLLGRADFVVAVRRLFRGS